MHPDIDKFAHLNSIIHSWDPRIKIFTILVLIFTIATIDQLPIAVLSLLTAFLLVVLSRIPLAFVSRRLLPVTIFLSPFFLILPLTMPGENNINMVGLSFNTGSLALAALIYLKAISIVILVVIMMGTAPFDVSMKALERLRVPVVLVQMILFSYRYIFVFLLEIRRMNTAMKARGFEKKTNFHTVATIGNFVGVLLVRSFERTERIYQAMLSRGYEGVIRTLFEYHAVATDYVKGSAVTLIAILIFIVDKFYDPALVINFITASFNLH